MQRHTAPAGVVIFNEGDTARSAYLVVSGEIDIVQGHGTSDRKLIAVMGKGEYFGEMGAIDDCPHSATAVAKTDVVYAAVTPEEFLETLRTRPGEAIDLLKVLFERLRVATRKIS